MGRARGPGPGPLPSFQQRPGAAAAAPWDSDQMFWPPEVFEKFASLVGENDSAVMSIIELTYKDKRDKILKVSAREAENLYDAISEIDPFKKRASKHFC